jgi:hypothetical protein
VFKAGPFGKISANGLPSGMGLVQNNSVPTDKTSQLGLSNGQIFLQKADGWFQFLLAGRHVQRPGVCEAICPEG